MTRPSDAGSKVIPRKCATGKLLARVLLSKTFLLTESTSCYGFVILSHSRKRGCRPPNRRDKRFHWLVSPDDEFSHPGKGILYSTCGRTLICIGLSPLERETAK